MVDLEAFCGQYRLSGPEGEGEVEGEVGAFCDEAPHLTPALSRPQGPERGSRSEQAVIKTYVLFPLRPHWGGRG